MSSPNSPVAVLASGGVDSALALVRLKAAGLRVEAFYLKIWLQDEFVSLGECPWEEDLSYLRPLTEHLGIPLHILPFQETYWTHIVDAMIASIRAGETPNPDLLCNARIKFGAFMKTLDGRMTKENQQTPLTPIASGHYARVVTRESETAVFYDLLTSPDALKDQTYFLSRLTQEQLRRIYFPIGELTKAEVRQAAIAAKLPNARRRDSQGLCFLGKIRFRDFIHFHLGTKEGKIIERESGKILGTHQGYWYHTPGQRQGLKLSSGPWYVSDKNVEENVVFVSREAHIFEQYFSVRAMHWIRGVSPLAASQPWEQASGVSVQVLEQTGLGEEAYPYDVKIRHGITRTPCRLKAGIEAGTFEIELQDKEAGIAPGQFAVFYAGESCLGSGIIKQVLRPTEA